MAKRVAFTIELDITTTGGFLTVDMIPLHDYDEQPTGDELLALQQMDAIKAAVFGVLRQIKFTGV